MFRSFFSRKLYANKTYRNAGTISLLDTTISFMYDNIKGSQKTLMLSRDSTVGDLEDKIAQELGKNTTVYFTIDQSRLSRITTLSSAVNFPLSLSIGDSIQPISHIKTGSATDNASLLSSKIKSYENELIFASDDLNVLVSNDKKKMIVKKSLFMTGLVAQFGILFYYVYEVYSWDVMEPFCYFLTVGYSLLSVYYFCFTKKSASYDNLLAGEGSKYEKAHLKFKSIQDKLDVARKLLKDDADLTKLMQKSI